MISYTTASKIAEQSGLKPEEQTEKDKIVVSNDAYAITDLIQQLINKIENVRTSLM